MLKLYYYFSIRTCKLFFMCYQIGKCEGNNCELIKKKFRQTFYLFRQVNYCILMGNVRRLNFFMQNIIKGFSSL